MTSWQPIETAPKDGTRILLWGPSVGVDFNSQIEYGQNCISLGAWDCMGWYGDFGEPIYAEPQKWMPVPEPPND